MFRTIRVSLLNDGIDVDPVLHEAGINVGKALYRRVADEDLNKFLKNIAAFWSAQKLGRIEVESTEPLILLVYDCFECQDLPYLGRPACAFDSGILQSLFSGYYEDPINVKETN